MSHLNTLKRKKTFKTKLTLISIFALSALLSANAAIAGPDKEIAPADEITEEITEQVTKEVKKNVPESIPENMQDPLQNRAEDEVSNIDTEGTVDGTVDSAMDSAMDGTMDDNEELTDVHTQVPIASDTPIIVEKPRTMKYPSQSIVVVPVEKNEKGCYPQDDGAIECVCETNQACEALKSSDICEPDTQWGNRDGFGGCTKKSEE